jgi:hypothetical protein
MKEALIKAALNGIASLGEMLFVIGCLAPTLG